MALECELLYELEPAVPFTCADGTAIPKGSLLTATDPFTVLITAGDVDKIVGIAAEEKVANDGKTTIGVYLRGVFKGFAGSDGTTVGRAIVTDSGTGAVNELMVADSNEEGIVGTAWDTVTDTQSFVFLLNPINPILA